MTIFEPLVIESWIYSTLKSDNTLQGLLAAVNNKSPNFQIGVYSTLAPEKDPFSKKMPQTPYIVFNRDGSASDDEDAICGGSFLSRPTYRVNVWQTSNGSISWNSIKSIANRVDTLLQNQTVTDSGITFICQRTDTAMPLTTQVDGKIDYALSFLYKFTISKAT
jgi:hypothetical protein